VEQEAKDLDRADELLRTLTMLFTKSVQHTLLPQLIYSIMWAGQLVRYSDWLRAGRSGDRILVGARFSALVQTGRGAHPAFCTMGTGSFPGVESGRGVTLNPHPLLVRGLKQSRAILLLSLRDFVACKKGETYLPIYSAFINQAHLFL
jgi:hypothetical protein